MVNFPTNIPFHLFTSCIIVKGFKRSCIYDLQRGNFEYIPNSLYDILIDNSRSLTYDELLKLYSTTEDKKKISDYFSFLYKEEFIFFSNLEKTFFPNYKLSFFKPYRVSSLILDILDFNFEQLLNIKNNINLVKVECLLLRFLSSDYELILKVLDFFDDISTRTIQLIINNEVKINDTQIENIFESNNRTSLIIKIDNKEYSKEFSKGYLVCTKLDLFKDREKINDISDFIPNLDLYIESVSFNTFYNKRFYINYLGEIFRHENDKKSFGNINLISLEDILVKRSFKKYWRIKKDNILVCKDCEYRYMCTDSRLPLYKNQDGFWVLEGDCYYNPYLAQWND